MGDDKDPVLRIEKSLGKTGLIGWEFAAAGKWDIAEHVFLENAPEQILQRVRNWFRQQTSDNIAFEALFQLASGEQFFFGVRFTHLEQDKKAKIIDELLFTGQKGDSLAHAVEKIRHVFDAPHMAATLPEYLELGVYDLWNRVGGLVVWKEGEKFGMNSAILLPEEISSRTRTPDEGFAPLHAPQPMPLMLEAAWNRNPETGQAYQCWLGLPVGEHNAGSKNTPCLKKNIYRWQQF